MRLRNIVSGAGVVLALSGCDKFSAMGQSINNRLNTPEPQAAPREPASQPVLSARFTRAKAAPGLKPLHVTEVTAFDISDTLPAGLEKKGIGVVPQKDYPTAEDPHQALGVVVLVDSGVKDTDWGSRVAVLRAEAGRQGANVIVSKGCRAAGEGCAALAFYLSSATPPSATPPSASAPREKASDEDIAAAIAAQIPGAKVTMNKNAARSGGATPAQVANLPVAEAVLAALSAEPPSKTAIPNNKALIAGLMAMWMPDSSKPKGVNFERELLRSVVYIETEGGKPKITPEGLMVALTDEKSAAPQAKLVAVPAVRLLEVARQKKIGVYLHHEGEASVFTGLTLDRIEEILAGRGKSPR